MSRLIRISECAECPFQHLYHYSRQGGCEYGCELHTAPPICPPTGTPAWCPLEQVADEASDTAAILLRTIAAEAERTGSWHVPPDLQERLKAWVAERDGRRIIAAEGGKS